MSYLLDTNAVIALINKSSESLARRLREHAPEDVVISAIVVQKLFYGAFKSRLVERHLAAIEELEFALVDFDKTDAREAGEIHAFLRKKGTAIGPYDVLIAGQARARDMILVTHNVDEFMRVPRLIVEDWEA